MKILWVLFVAAWTKGRRRQKNDRDCYRPETGEYTGQVATTVNGFTCQKWNAQSPHRPKKRPTDTNHNFCRNPDNDPNGPWCYTTDRNKRYDYCDVKHCADSSSKRKIAGKTCIASNDHLGEHYTGTHRFARVNGKRVFCQSWNAVEPHRSMHNTGSKHNYCRNPDKNADGPWCYIHYGQQKTGSCSDIPSCDDRPTKAVRATCGVPAVSPVFSKAAKPTTLRTRRGTDQAHIENPGEKYNTQYDYYDSSETNLPTRHKTFVKDLQTSETNQRIIGGQEVKAHSFPWQVSIRYKAERLAFCGGSIVTAKWVLTAAHCMMDEPTSLRIGACYKAVTNLEVFAGTHTKAGNDRTKDMSKQSRGVKMFCMHPKWDAVDIYGDASLMEMKTPFTLNDFVYPICLPTLDAIVPQDTMCVITGFGKTQGTADERVLNQQTLPIKTNKKCNQQLGQGTLPDESQMCAGFNEGGVDTCQGDSGGPLACKHKDGVWMIEGITSWGYGCGDKNSPGVYTRVASSTILNWVKHTAGVN